MNLKYIESVRQSVIRVESLLSTGFSTSHRKFKFSAWFYADVIEAF